MCYMSFHRGVLLMGVLLTMTVTGGCGPRPGPLAAAVAAAAARAGRPPFLNPANNGSDVLIFTLLLLVMCDCMRRADKNMARGFNYLTSTLAYIASCRVSKLVAVVGPDTYGQRSLACLQGHTFAVFHAHSLILADSQLLQRISTLVRFCAGSTRFLPILRQLAVTSRQDGSDPCFEQKSRF